MTTSLITRSPDGGLGAALAWHRLEPDERRRLATAAARDRDAAALWLLTEAHLATHGRASASTRSNYERAIRRLVEAWTGQGVNLLRPDADAGHLYARGLEERHATATVRVHLAGCQALYRALRWTAATSAHPFADVRVAKVDERRADERREAFSEAELTRMVQRADPVDRVLLMLGARAGLRLAETLALTWADVRLEGDDLRLTVRQGKGGRDRTIPLAPELVDTLRSWRASSATEFVLPYRSPTRARQRLRRVQVQAGVRIDRGRAVHSLRHAFGTAVFATSGDLVAAQSLLGHADVSTTRGYVHRAARAQLRDVTAALPRLTEALPVS